MSSKPKRTRRRIRFLAGFLVLCVVGTVTTCAGTGFDPARIPETERYLVVVKSVRLPAHVGWFPSLAHHSYFDLKKGSENDWIRLEVMSDAVYSAKNVLRRVRISAAEARNAERWEHPVHLHGVTDGDTARAAIANLERLAGEYADSRNYRAWAGPNSNTFVDRLARQTPGLRFDQHHNAIGKDYTPLIRVGGTTTGTGFEIETWPAGIQVGLQEGIELHLLQLTFGIDFWPPAIKIPFLPRIGL